MPSKQPSQFRFKRLLAVGIVTVVVVSSLFVIFGPALLPGPNLVMVTWYNEDRVVGTSTASWLPGAWMLEGQNVTGFTVAVAWSTDDPSVTQVTVDAKVVCWVSGNQGASAVATIPLLAGSTPVSAGQVASARQSLDTCFSAVVPAGSSFVLDFRASVAFKNASGALVKDLGWLNPVSVAGSRTAYTYTARILPGGTAS